MEEQCLQGSNFCEMWGFLWAVAPSCLPTFQNLKAPWQGQYPGAVMVFCWRTAAEITMDSLGSPESNFSFNVIDITNDTSSLLNHSTAAETVLWHFHILSFEIFFFCLFLYVQELIPKSNPAFAYSVRATLRKKCVSVSFWNTVRKILFTWWTLQTMHRIRRFNN